MRARGGAGRGGYRDWSGVGGGDDGAGPSTAGGDGDEKETPEQKKEKERSANNYEKPRALFTELTGRQFGVSVKDITIMYPDEQLKDGRLLAKEYDEFMDLCWDCVLIAADTDRSTAHNLLRLARRQTREREVADTLEQPAYRLLKEEMEGLGLSYEQMADRLTSIDDSKMSSKQMLAYGPLCTIQIAAEGQVLYMRVSVIDWPQMLTERSDAVARRIQRMRALFQNRNVVKVFCDAKTDVIPMLCQTGIDVVGWVDLNILAEGLGFGKDLGRADRRQNQGLKKIAAKVGIQLDEFDMFTNFASARVWPSKVQYALRDALAPCDIAIMLIICYTKSINQVIMMDAILDNCRLESNVAPSRFEVPAEAEEQMKPIEYRDFRSEEVRKKIIFKYSKKRPYTVDTAAGESRLSQINGFVMKLRRATSNGKTVDFGTLNNILKSYVETGSPCLPQLVAPKFERLAGIQFQRRPLVVEKGSP